MLVNSEDVSRCIMMYHLMYQYNDVYNVSRSDIPNSPRQSCHFDSRFWFTSPSNHHFIILHACPQGGRVLHAVAGFQIPRAWRLSHHVTMKSKMFLAPWIPWQNQLWRHFKGYMGYTWFFPASSPWSDCWILLVSIPTLHDPMSTIVHHLWIIIATEQRCRNCRNLSYPSIIPSYIVWIYHHHNLYSSHRHPEIIQTSSLHKPSMPGNSLWYNGGCMALPRCTSWRWNVG